MAFASVKLKVVATLGKIDLETQSSLKTERQIMLHQNEKHREWEGGRLSDQGAAV